MAIASAENATALINVTGRNATKASAATRNAGDDTRCRMLSCINPRAPALHTRKKPAANSKGARFAVSLIPPSAIQ